MTRPMRPRLAHWLLAALFLPSLVACDGSSAPEPVVQEYSVRGVVRALPDADRRGTDLYVHHEAIPDFVNQMGETVGMDSMAMPFPVLDPAILDGFAVGDKVTMRFEVEWDGSPPLRVVALEPLDAATNLTFETTASDDDPAADEQPSEPAGHDHGHPDGDGASDQPTPND